MLEQTMSAIVLSPLPIAGGEGAPQAGAGRRKVTAKALKRALKKAGLKTTGKKAALSRRAKKAHLKVGGAGEPGDDAGADLRAIKVEELDADGGRRRRKSRKNGIVQGVYRGTTGLAKGTLRSVGRLGRSVFGRGGKVSGEDE
jgi:hypothetical protein